MHLKITHLQNIIFLTIRKPYCSFFACLNMSDEDFNEEEVWSFVKEKKEVSPNTRRGKHHSFFTSSSSSSSSSNSSSTRPHTTSRLISKSAPIIIPDWSKIYRQKSFTEDINGGDHNARDDDDDDEFNADGDRVPPHEWIAKKLARSKISSFSVCEGAGRTLKGRDQCKVRNDVLTRTGFLE